MLIFMISFQGIAPNFLQQVLFRLRLMMLPARVFVHQW